MRVCNYCILDFFPLVDTDESDSFCSPAKRTSVFFSPYSAHANHLSSSGSSPDHPSDSNGNHCSCDEDSGNENAFLSHHINLSATTALSTTPMTNSPVNSSILTCDTKHASSGGFAKPRYIAPQSPLAAGVNSASTNEIIRKSTLGATSYTFTPVKE